MCGIVAVVRRARRRLPPRAARGRAHARLGVIDLATGDQPIESEDGRLCLVANGEFYDYERTRAELARRTRVPHPHRQRDRLHERLGCTAP